MMKKLLWLLLLPVNLAFSILCVIVSPLAACFVTPNRRHLRSPFKWLDTIDNDLSGDDGWKQEHLIGTDPLSWINRTRWLIRNGGNKVSYSAFGCRETRDTQHGFYYVNTEGYWLYRRPLPITSKCFIDLFIGWNLPGPKYGRAKYTSSFRLKTKL